MIDRIQALREEAEEAIASRQLQRDARGAACALPRPQGRAAAAAARRSRAPARAARRGRQDRQRGAPDARGADRRARRSSSPRRARAAAARRPRRRHAARAPRHSRSGACTCSHPPGASSRTSSSASASPSWKAPRWRPSTTTSTRSTTAPRTPRARAPTPSTQGRETGPAHPHLADAGARDGGAPAAAVRGRARARLPPRLRRHPHAPVPPDRGARRRRGHHARRPQGHAADVRPRDLRRRARGAPAPALLPLHRAQRRGRRVLLPLLRQGLPRATARAARCARARAGWRSSAPARSTRTSTRRRPRPTPTRPATTRSACRASPSGWASSGSRCSATASPTCASTSTTTCASWSSSDESARPRSWLREYCDPRSSTARRSRSA